MYIDEPDSHVALSLIRRKDLEPMISWLSEVEMSAALYTKSARLTTKLASASVELAHAAFRLDRANSKYQVAPVDEGVFESARFLGKLYGCAFSVRALDVLHVAAALKYGAAAFGTFDGRQGKLAQAVGLKLLA